MKWQSDITLGEAPREPPDLREAFEIVHHADTERAAEKFHTYGFCLLGEALPAAQLQRLRVASGAANPGGPLGPQPACGPSA